MKPQRRRFLSLLAASAGTIHGASNIGRSETGTGPDDRSSRRSWQEQGQGQDTEVERAAREGAEQAISTLRESGVPVTDQGAQAAIEGAVTGIVTEHVGGASSDQIRAIANAAVLGTVAPLTNYGDQLSIDHVLWTAYGSAGGAESAVSTAAQEGRQIGIESISANTMGAAEAAISEAGYIVQQTGTAVEPTHVLGAALGASTGIYIQSGQQVPPDRVYAATLGAGGGGVQSAHQRQTQGQPPQTDHTIGATAGAASGSIEGAAQNPDVTPDRVYESSYGAAVGTLSQPQLVEFQQIYEFAFRSAIGALAPTPEQQPPEDAPIDEQLPPETPEPPEGFEDDELPPQPEPEPEQPESGAGTPFAEPIVVDQFSPPIGPPQDLDGDGLYEDVDATGEPDYIDVVKLSQIVQAYQSNLVALSEEQIAALDFNGDGVLDPRDVRALDERVTG